MLIHVVLSTTIACLFTSLGGIFALLKKSYHRKSINVALNASAGVMLGASFYSLLLPSYNLVRANSENIYLSALYYIIAIMCGGGILWVLNFVVPHEHDVNENKKCENISYKAVILFVLAMAIHKLPEGFAMGVAYGAGDVVNPLSLVTGIALQNIPEGLMVTISLIAINCNRIKSLLIATLIAFVQPLGAIFGYLAMNVTSVMLPYGMAFAGSTMLFVIINEILPEAYGGEENKKSSIALFLGFIIMSYITVVLD